MNKIKNKIKLIRKTEPSKAKSNDISEIEEKIDKLMFLDKQKPENKIKKLNVNNFSIKNQRGDVLFYIKKGSDKKKEDSETLSKEIIQKARINLGKNPTQNEPVFEEKKPDLQITDKKTVRRIRFGRQKKEIKIQESFEKTKDTNGSKNLDEVAKEIDKKDEGNQVIGKSKSNDIDIEKEHKIIDELIDQFEKSKSTQDIHKNNEFKIKNDDFEKADSKIIDEKIKQEPEIRQDIASQEIIKEKANDFAKKHRLFDKSDEKADKDDSSDNKFTKSEDLKEVNMFEDSDANLVDDQIKKSSDKPENIEKEVDVKSEIKLNAEKKSFFGRQKTTTPEVEANLETRPPAQEFKPKFKVENLPKNDDKDLLLIDQKIKINFDEVEDEDTFKEIEEKAHKLAKEHIKQKPSPVNATQINKKEKANNETNPNFGLAPTPGSKKEHVFFDEDASTGGWSPHSTDIEKKAMYGTVEIQDEQLGEVKDVELPKEVLKIKSVTLAELGFSEYEWEELDFYPLQEPFAYVEVLRENDTLEKCYFLVEVDLTEEEQKVLDFINETINNISFDTEKLEDEGTDDYLANSVDQVIAEYNLKIDKDSMNKILYYLSKTSLGLGKIDPLMRDPNIEDISCDGSGVPLFLYHRQFGSLKSNVSFSTEEELSSFVFKLAQKCGKHISIAEPMLDATMPDGSRIQMTLSDEITARGSTFTIRKFRADPFSPPDLIEFNTMSAEMIAYLWLAVENGINMLFAGGTASGKTTTLNAISLFIPPESKIVSIEETREINLPHPNWIPGVARTGFGQTVSDKVVGEIDMYDLMKAALRQRPEYILVGEIRGREAYVLFQAMATGHATYSTVHADSAQSLIHRLEGKPINIPRVMLQSLDVVSLHVITRVKNKRARRCKQIIEIIDIDPTTKEILTNEVFRWDPVEDKFIYSGKSYVLERIRAEKDYNREEMTNEIKNRQKLVDMMNKNNVRGFRDVAHLISRYLDNPAETIKQIERSIKK